MDVINQILKEDKEFPEAIMEWVILRKLTFYHTGTLLFATLRFQHPTVVPTVFTLVPLLLLALRVNS